jgi:hypothetical protein
MTYFKFVIILCFLSLSFAQDYIAVNSCIQKSTPTVSTTDTFCEIGHISTDDAWIYSAVVNTILGSVPSATFEYHFIDDQTGNQYALCPPTVNWTPQITWNTRITTTESCVVATAIGYKVVFTVTNYVNAKISEGSQFFRFRLTQGGVSVPWTSAYIQTGQVPVLRVPVPTVPTTIPTTTPTIPTSVPTTTPTLESTVPTTTTIPTLEPSVPTSESTVSTSIPTVSTTIPTFMTSFPMPTSEGNKLTGSLLLLVLLLVLLL